jgi:hypothetical protein
MRENGRTLLEALIALLVVALLAAAAVPTLKAYSIEAHILGAGRVFKGEFRRAHSIAVRSGRQTALRFERSGADDVFSLYADGNGNGVLSAEIRSGVDIRIAGPFPLTGGAPGVRVGINPGIPAPPPERGTLDPADPIRFGRSNMVSFSPLGTATPGTFYLAGEGVQGAVRVTGTTARVRLMVWRGGRWREHP